MLKKKVRLLSAAAATVCVLGFAATGSASTNVVMTSGPVTGTQLVTLEIDADGGATKGPIETITGGQPTHGGYLNYSGTKLYVNGFTGGGMQVWHKSGDSWALNKTVPSMLARMMCATDLKDGFQDPDTGLLSVSDISTGFMYDFDMSKDDWATKSPVGNNEMGSLQGVGTTCDTSFAENPYTGIAWSSGHSNAVYTWDFATSSSLLPVPLPIGNMPTLKNIRPGETTLGHQNTTFSTSEGHEYVAIADGSAGQFIIYNAADDTEVGRITVGGESHAMGIVTEGASNRLISPYAVTANFAVGSLKVFRLIKADGTPNVDGDGQEKPTVTSEIPGIGSAADICGVDFVSKNGIWNRN